MEVVVVVEEEEEELVACTATAGVLDSRAVKSSENQCSLRTFFIRSLNSGNKNKWEPDNCLRKQKKLWRTVKKIVWQSITPRVVVTAKKPFIVFITDNCFSSQSVEKFRHP